MQFQFFASPFWVNLAWVIPIILVYFWREGLKLDKQQLITLALFSLSFGILEAVVVVYLRTISNSTSQISAANSLPNFIVNLEVVRETCTMIMLATISFAAANFKKERLALFFYNYVEYKRCLLNLTLDFTQPTLID